MSDNDGGGGRGYDEFSHVPLVGTALGRVFRSIVGVREEVVAPILKKPHRLRKLAILYTESGEGLNVVRDRRLPVRPGSIVVQPRGQTYVDRTVKLPWRLRYLML